MTDQSGDNCVRTFDWDNTFSASNWVGGANYAFPQGRNITGYQFVDDLSWTRASII